MVRIWVRWVHDKIVNENLKKIKYEKTLEFTAYESKMIIEEH